jgi:pilus assembly protein CpaB
MDLTRLTRVIDGAPFAAPALLDRASERWWQLPPRLRGALLAMGIVVALAAGTVHLAASPWGAPVTVLVATDDLVAGQRLHAGDVRRADWPAALVPEGAIREPNGTVVAPVPAGGVVTDRHVGDGGLGTMIPDGRAAVALPLELLPELPSGTQLDLVGADLDTRGVVLARGAVVIATDDLHVWLVVDRQEAADVAAATLTGAVTVVVVPP